MTLLDLDDACFTTANPQLSLVRGEQIQSALEKWLDPELMQTYFKAFRGSPMGLPAISGMVVDYDPSASAGERVRQIAINGSILENDRLYHLAHTDAEVWRDITPFGQLKLEDGQLIRTEVPTILREVIEAYMTAHSPVPKPVGGRWRKVFSQISRL